LPRKNIYSTKAAFDILPKLTDESGMPNASAYLSKLVIDAAAKEPENMELIKECLAQLRRAENENGKNVSVVLEILNTYVHMFADDEGNRSAFFPVSDQPHEWTKKAFEVVEAKIRVDRYSKRNK